MRNEKKSEKEENNQVNVWMLLHLARGIMFFKKVSSLSLTSNDSLCEYYNYVSVSWYAACGPFRNKEKQKAQSAMGEVRAALCIST